MSSPSRTATNREDIEKLVEARVSESKVLDYKQELYGDDKKKDFLVDVTALANTNGGRLVIGVTELREGGKVVTGIPAEATGVPCTNPSEVVGRWTNWLKDINACDPPLNSVHFEVVDGFAEGPVFVIDVPKSWLGPHRVSVNKQSFFYLRTSFGNQPMDTREIRQAMLLADSLWDRMRKWRAERVALISEKQGQLVTAGQVEAVVHVMPLESFTGELAIDVNEPGLHRALPFAFEGGQLPRNNFDGVISTVMPGRPVTHYSQMHRNGLFEGVLDITNDNNTIAGEYWEDKTSKYVLDVFEFLKPRLQGGIFIGLSIVGCMGRKFGLGQRIEAEACDRAVMMLPEVEVEIDQEFSEDTLRRTLSPAYDVAWQAVGLRRSPYDKGERESR